MDYAREVHSPLLLFVAGSDGHNCELSNVIFENCESKVGSGAVTIYGIDGLYHPHFTTGDKCPDLFDSTQDTRTRVFLMGCKFINCKGTTSNAITMDGLMTEIAGSPTKECTPLIRLVLRQCVFYTSEDSSISDPYDSSNIKQSSTKDGTCTSSACGCPSNAVHCGCASGGSSCIGCGRYIYFNLPSFIFTTTDGTASSTQYIRDFFSAQGCQGNFDEDNLFFIGTQGYN
ncbi:MAG: hypothetical protein EZS28_043957, partial [Streblomastix strix]